MSETPRSETPRSGTSRTESLRGSHDGSGTARQPASAGSEAAQTRARHDQGRYRDKIPVADPAASPLGTDSEAAGVSIPEGAIEPASPAGSMASQDTHPQGHARGEVPQGAEPWLWVMGGAVGVIVVALTVLLFSS